jgi:drug/metabolite transporter (DMT)-like permease
MALALYLLANVCVAAIFKVFPRYRVNAFHAIVINYTICFLLGAVLNPEKKGLHLSEIVQTPWFKLDVILGVIFIGGFTITAKAIETAGITLTTMMQKMSILLSVTCTVLFFHEPFGLWQIIGMVFAITAIIAINQRPDEKAKNKNLLLLTGVLLSSALIEVILLFAERRDIIGEQHYLFTSYGFGFAALAGWCIIAWQWLRARQPIARQAWAGGLILGLPNFLTIFLLLVMLQQGWNASILYPVLNVTVLTLITLTAWLVFKEKLRLVNWLGIAAAMIAILLIGLLQPVPDAG